MSDEPSFPSPKRSTKPPARPPGASDLKGKQKTLANLADRLYRRAREEGWSRKRFYEEINGRPGLKGLRKDIKDNLIDHYKEPRSEHLRKKPRKNGRRHSVISDSLLDTFRYYGKDLDENGADYDIVETDEGGYEVYTMDDSDSPYTA